MLAPRWAQLRGRSPNAGRTQRRVVVQPRPRSGVLKTCCNGIASAGQPVLLASFKEDALGHRPGADPSANGYSGHPHRWASRPRAYRRRHADGPSPPSLPPGFTTKWTGYPREEVVGLQYTILFAFSLLARSSQACGAAERTSARGAAAGATRRRRVVLGADLRGLPGERITIKVGMITHHRPAALRTVPIIEFAMSCGTRAAGGLVDSVREALPPRFRPIPMTCWLLGPRPWCCQVPVCQPARHRHRRFQRYADGHAAGGAAVLVFFGYAAPVPGSEAPAAL